MFHVSDTTTTAGRPMADFLRQGDCPDDFNEIEGDCYQPVVPKQGKAGRAVSGKSL